MPNRTVEAALDAALRREPEVGIPPHFANRVVASLPPPPADSGALLWVLPALTLAGAAALGSLGWTAVELGWSRWVMQPSVLATILGMEAVASLVWVWRVFRSAR